MSANKSTLSFYGGVETPTGSNFLLEIKGKKILVDCGVFQGSEEAYKLNRKPFPYKPEEIDALFVTHAHRDHTGRIPKLVKEGYRGPVYSTPQTKKIAKLIFEDGLKIAQYDSSDSDPLYEKEDVEKALSQWKELPYYEEKGLGKSVAVTLHDAGHILGSALVVIEHEGRKIVFSGDLGNSPAPLLRPTDMIEDAHYMVLESVYGDRTHESTEDRTAILEDVIEETVSNEGVLMIPAFSIERTQILLYEINNLVEQGKIPALPVFLDSPLAIKVTEVYKNAKENFNKETKHIIAGGDDIFKFPNLTFTRSVKSSKEIDKTPNPKIIIAGSGMSEGGRIIIHEKKYLRDPKNTLLIVGFQAAGSVGRKLQEGAKEVEIDGEKVKVRARVETLLGYSAHSDVDGLIDFVEASTHSLEKVFVVLGEPKSAAFLAQRLRDYLGVDAVVPSKGDHVFLDL